MLRNKFIAAFFTLTSAFCVSTYAIAGIGIQWGNDFSMHMDDKTGEPLVFKKLAVNVPNYGPISGADIPITVNRTGWERKVFNFGVKFYIDIIPILDALELSANYGAWEYNGSITYPTSIAYNSTTKQVEPANFQTMPITLDEFDMGYLGIKNTPYMKLNFDLTVRKYIIQFPKPLKTLNLYGGGGLSLIFATPLLTSQLVEDALGSKLNTTLAESALLGTNLFGNKDVMEKVVKEISGQLMTPHWGCHIDLGVMIKLPVIPVGFYVDGKLMIPFKDLDEKVDVGGTGILLNTGISLTF